MRHELATEQRSIEALAESLRHQPPAIIRAVNERRAAMMLPAIPALPPAVARRSAATPPPQQLEHRATARVWAVCHPGTAPAPRGHDLPEIILPTAWSEQQLNGIQSLWTIRSGGHGATAVASSCGRRLRAHVDPKVGLVVEWIPEMNSQRDRGIVAEIEAGRRAVSIGFRRLGVRQERRGGSLVTVVTRAQLAHVAILGWNQSPAYRQASAWVMRGGDSPEELRKQQAEAIRRATFLPLS